MALGADHAQAAREQDMHALDGAGIVVIVNHAAGVLGGERLVILGVALLLDGGLAAQGVGNVAEALDAAGPVCLVLLLVEDTRVGQVDAFLVLELLRRRRPFRELVGELRVLGLHVCSADADGAQMLADIIVGHGLGIAAEQDVGTTAGHVGRDGHGTLATRLCNDLGLTLMVLGIQNLMVDAALGEDGRQALRAIDRRGAHQAGLTRGVALGHVIGHRSELGVNRLIDEVVVVPADHGAVGRDAASSVTAVPVMPESLS